MSPLPVIDLDSCVQEREATRPHPETRSRQRRPVHPRPAGNPGPPTTRRDP